MLRHSMSRMRVQWSNDYCRQAVKLPLQPPPARHACFGVSSIWQAALSEARSKLAAVENASARTEEELAEANSQLKLMEV